MIRIAVDLMGSDLGCQELSKGVLDFMKNNQDTFFY
ncbi:MAG TPA: phosphate acyltransferase, partial [Treponema sp.]|nr:phosphate acyltransferase [Treponema sp.]